MTDSQQPPLAQPPGETEHSPPVQRQRNVLGIVALAIAVLGFIFGAIPGALILGWILLPVGFILGLVSLFRKNAVKWQGVTALIVSVIGTIVAFIVFFVVAAGVASDMTESSVTDGDSSTVTEESDEPAAEGDATAEADATDEPAASTGAGTREDPAALGSKIESDEWTVVINSVTLDANDAVAAANEFNTPPTEGNGYIVINYTATYTGTDPDGSTPALVGIEYVTADGVTVDGLESVAVAPDPIDSLSTLYEGASVTGNMALQVPTPPDGVLAVRPGVVVDKVFVAIK